MHDAGRRHPRPLRACGEAISSENASEHPVSVGAPDGGDAWAPAKPRPDETLIRALARAHRWKRLLEEGKYRSAAEIAEAEGVTRSFVNRLLRLTLLSPDIVEAILDGWQPKGMQLEELAGTIPSSWEEQKKPPIQYHPERTR